MAHVKGYVAVFAALLMLTVATVAVSSLQLSVTAAIALGLTIASAKAALVVLFFMHLKSEKAMVFWPLALTMFLFFALFAFVLWTEADHIVLTTSRVTTNHHPVITNHYPPSTIHYPPTS
jgi:cytochrome c oxidase subunit IV